MAALRPAAHRLPMRIPPMSRSGEPTTPWTYAEYARLPDDGNRYEVIDGEVCVTPAPSPRHQRIAAKLFRRLDDYLREHRLGEVFWDVDLLFATGQFLRPDLVVVGADALHAVTDRGVEEVPLLVVEVLSPHSQRIDRVKKPPRYRTLGVPWYWVVDPETRALELHALAEGDAVHVERERVVWQPVAAQPALVFAVAELFTAA
jgi:Uma2 family endonuclease